jgi:thiamine pyrophosphokinase
MKLAVIIGNGQKPETTVLNYILNLGPVFIVAADGGANHLYDLGILPDLIIGDMDSITPEAEIFFQGKTQFEKLERQDDTDIEKAVKYLISENYSDAILVSCDGFRLDHSINNISHLIKYFDRIKLRFIDSETFAVPYFANVELSTQIGETISLYGFSDKTRVSSEGLKYELNDMLLQFGFSDSTSNESNSVSICLAIEGGIIIIFRNLQTAIKYDYLLPA